MDHVADETLAERTGPVRIVSTPKGYAYCEPDTCPCDNGLCTLARYTRSVATSDNGVISLEDSEAAVAERLTGLPINVSAMAAVSNINRAANALRNQFERTVLAPHDLTWTGWVVLWVVWIWGDIETRHVAAEAGISKGTLTGVSGTLETRGFINRVTHPKDGRRKLLSLTPAGDELMQTLFPLLNQAEVDVLSCISKDETDSLARLLRRVVIDIEESDVNDAH